MNVKSVVKVMNFHSLLRVDNSRRRAERYATMANELGQLMRIILNNRNLRLDKIVTIPNKKLPPLKIYIGSDYGFCGGVNAAVSSNLLKDEDSEKLIIGKKLRRSKEYALYLPFEDIEPRFTEIKGYFEKAVRDKCWSSIEIVYNRYYNIGSIKQVTERIYPLDIKPNERESTSEGDFIIEGDPDSLFSNMIVTYLVLEFRIAVASSYASENIMRQNATSESLKKLDEMEEEENKLERKIKNQISFSKTVDSYIKQKMIAKIR